MDCDGHGNATCKLGTDLIEGTEHEMSGCFGMQGLEPEQDDGWTGGAFLRKQLVKVQVEGYAGAAVRLCSVKNGTIVGRLQASFFGVNGVDPVGSENTGGAQRETLVE